MNTNTQSTLHTPPSTTPTAITNNQAGAGSRTANIQKFSSLGRRPLPQLPDEAMNGSTGAGIGPGVTSGTMTTGRGAGGKGSAAAAGSMGMASTAIGAKVAPPTISQSVSSAEQMHHQQQQQQHFRSLQRDGAANATGAGSAGGVNPGTWQDGAATTAAQYQQYGAVPAYGVHHHHLHQQQGMHPFRSLQRGSTAQLPAGGVHTSHSHSGHFRSAAAANKAAAAHQLQQQQQQQKSDASIDGTYANNDSERQLYAVTEL